MEPHTALCWKKLPDRNSSWPAIPGGRHCHKLPGHSGSCGEFGFLNNLKSIDNKIANKVKRDSWNTTGAAWKTKKAGPNRMPRYVAALPIEEFEKALKEKGFNLNELSNPEKIIEKGATYTQCINVAIKLTREALSMKGAPTPSTETTEFFSKIGMPIIPNDGKCLICLGELNFDDFSSARVGTADIVTAHANPRIHEVSNVGFAHHTCNVAQGNRTLEEFYDWMLDILIRVGYVE